MKLAYKDLFEVILNTSRNREPYKYPTTVSLSQHTMDEVNSLLSKQGENAIRNWKESPFEVVVDDTVPDGHAKVSFTFKWDQS